MPSWVPAEEAKPAPPSLLVVQAFVNTYEADRDTDLLREPDTARQWFVQAGLLDRRGALRSAELETATGMREAIRAMLEANAGGPGPTPAQRRQLAALAARGALRLTIERGHDIGIDAEAASPLDAALLRLLVVIRDAQRDGTWTRLKACSNAECRWVYYDRSHSQRGRWCDMAVCGNRLKNRALRARKG